MSLVNIISVKFGPSLDLARRAFGTRVDPKLIGDLLCHNQGRYVQYEYILGERHKDLKTALASRDSTAKDIRGLISQLVDYSNNELADISKENFDYLLKYFNGRSELVPRICIKILNKKNQIVDVFRTVRAYYVDPHDIHENTGFQQVVETGRFYICNNIPNKAKKGLYGNPRLDKQRVPNYNEPKRLGFFSKDDLDNLWCDCWFKKSDGVSNDIAPELRCMSCYKSTLILPMTLMNNRGFDAEFQSKFFGKIPEKSRGIWGFLCLDHPKVNYFNRNDDILVGYIFADIMSLYFISNFVHTEISKTFAQAKMFVDNAEGGGGIKNVEKRERAIDK